MHKNISKTKAQMRTVYTNAQTTPALLSEPTKYGSGKAFGLHSAAIYIQYLSSLSLTCTRGNCTSDPTRNKRPFGANDLTLVKVDIKFLFPKHASIHI